MGALFAGETMISVSGRYKSVRIEDTPRIVYIVEKSVFSLIRSPVLEPPTCDPGSDNYILKKCDMLSKHN